MLLKNKQVKPSQLDGELPKDVSTKEVVHVKSVMHVPGFQKCLSMFEKTRSEVGFENNMNTLSLTLWEDNMRR